MLFFSSLSRSKVDQIWSIAPVLYSWYFIIHLCKRPNHSIDCYFITNKRLSLITALITCWGIRLTFNFWRRGGYGNLITHEEDYRWEYVRKGLIPEWCHMVFNLGFVAFYQNLLLWLICLPVFAVYSSSLELGLVDVLLALLFMTFLIIETVADQQQWNFQSFKLKIPKEVRF